MVAELGGRLGLAHHPALDVGRAGDDLDGHRPPHDLVVGEIHGGERPAAQLADDPVAIVEKGGVDHAASISPALTEASPSRLPAGGTHLRSGCVSRLLPRRRAAAQGPLTEGLAARWPRSLQVRESPLLNAGHSVRDRARLQTGSASHDGSHDAVAAGRQPEEAVEQASHQ